MHARSMTRAHAGIWALALAAALAAGCADLTSGGATGQSQAYLAGDEPPAGAAPAEEMSRMRGEGAALRAANATATVDANLTTGVQVYLEGGPEGTVELTSGVQTVTTPAQGAAAVKIADMRVVAGVYATVKVVFTRVEADVRSGLTVGGVPITGVVRVSASASDPIVIERVLQVEVTESGTAAVLVDLNAPVWLATAAPGTNLVARSAFSGAVQVVRR